MLVKNQLIRLHGELMRILAIHGETLWAYPIDKPKGLPLSLTAGLAKQAEAVSKDTSVAAPRMSPTETRRAKEAYSRIEPLLAHPGIYDSAERNAAIRQRASELRCSPQTLLKDLRRYWAGGQTLAALAGQFHRCGNTTKHCRRGPTPTYGTHQSYILTDDDASKLNAAIRRYYLRKENASIPAAYQRLLEKHYSYTDGNGQSYLRSAGECPSLRQFRYYLEKNFSLEERLRGRHGDQEFERNHRARLGFALQDCLGPGHIYELDATIADCWIVASKDRSKIIGKPTLYLVYDKWSRLVTGFYVGLEAPSWPAAMQAIVSIAEDKAALCQRYGVPYDPADWPAHSVFPQTLVGDRGEMLSKASSLLATNLSISVKNAPALRPDRKGTVECGFKLLQRSMADSVPGYDPPENFSKRRGKKYDKDACLTLHEFTAIMLRNIVTHNRKAMKGYPLSAEQLCQGIRPVPVELWTEGIERRAGQVTRYDENVVKLALLPVDRAVVTREGILFKGCYYTCSEAVKHGWFVRAGRKGRFRVGVSYDRRLVDTIYLHNDKDRTYIEATLTERSIGHKGLAFDEIAAYEYFWAKLRHDVSQGNAQEVADFHGFVDGIATSAKKAMRDVSRGKSRTSRKKDIAEDRVAERRVRRQQEVPLSRPDKPQAEPAQVLPFTGRPADQTSGAGNKNKLELLIGDWKKGL